MKRTIIGLSVLLNGLSISGQTESEVIGFSDNIEQKEFHNFLQVKPVPGNNPSYATKVSLWHTDEHLYVLFTAFQPESNPPYATSMERDDNMEIDDHVELIIDSYNDKTNALMFRANSIGTKMDAEIGNNGEVLNYNWNTFWDVETEVTESGWKALFKIPFSSLRFKKSDLTIMGFKFGRFIKTENESLIYPLTDLKQRLPQFDCINMEQIEFENINPIKPLYITPYIKSDYSRDLDYNEQSEKYLYKSELLQTQNYSSNEGLDKLLSNIGLDLKFKPRNNHTIDLTLNTDFSQVEADDRVVNLTRYSIAVPEKRAFFLENQDNFNSNMFGHKLFHSRRIGLEENKPIPIVGGVKLTGGTDGYQYGLLTMQSRNVTDSATYFVNYSVARLKLGLDQKESYIGAIITNKEDITNKNYNRVLGLDGLLALGRTTKVTYHLASSIDTNNFNIDNFSYGAQIYRFPSEGYQYNFRYREYRKSFNPELGFLARTDNRRATMNHGYRILPKKSKYWTLFVMGVYITQYWESATGLKDWFQINGYWAARDKNGNVLLTYFPYYSFDRLYSPWEFSDGVVIPTGSYEMWRISPFYTSGFSKKYQFNFSFEYGGFYGGRKTTVRGGITWTINRHLKLEGNFNYNTINFPQEYASNSPRVDRYIISNKMSVYLSPKLSIKSLIQYDNVSELIGLNFRLRYHPKEGSDLYLVYNQGTWSTSDYEYGYRPHVETQNIAIKYSYTFIR